MGSELRKIYGPSLVVVQGTDIWTVLANAVREDRAKAKAFIEAMKGIQILEGE
jgi:hypothetical protein